MANEVMSLFGITPEALQAQREQQLQQQALQFAQLSPMQAAQAGFYTAGNRLGTAVGGLLGAQDPELARATALQGILKNIDSTTPEGLAAGAKQLAQAGFGVQAMQLAEQAQQTQLRAAQTGKAAAEQRKIDLSVAQEDKLRQELASLGPDATEADILKVVTKYGPPDKIMAALQTAQAKRESLASQEQRAQEALVSRERMAQEANATRMMIAQMQNATTQMLGTITAGMKREQLDEKALTADQAKLGALASFDTALTSLDELKTHPGKSAAVGLTGKIQSAIPGTDAYGFASKLEAFKAQTFIPQVAALKGMGALSDAEGKKLTDAVGALDQGMKKSEFDSQIAKISTDLAVAKKRAESTIKNKQLIQPFMELKNKISSAPEAPASQSGWAIKIKQ